MIKYLGVAIVLLAGCETVPHGEQGECLRWKTVEVVRKEFLPYPMTGYIERVETRPMCAVREEKDDTALALRRPAIYV